MIRPWETVNGERDKGRSIIRKPIIPKRRKPAPLDTDIRWVLTAVCIGGFIGERMGPRDTGTMMTLVPAESVGTVFGG